MLGRGFESVILILILPPPYCECVIKVRDPGHRLVIVIIIVNIIVHDRCAVHVAEGCTAGQYHPFRLHCAVRVALLINRASAGVAAVGCRGPLGLAPYGSCSKGHFGISRRRGPPYQDAGQRCYLVGSALSSGLEGARWPRRRDHAGGASFRRAERADTIRYRY